MKIPSELKYTRSHEWVRPEADAVVVGITDFAQAQLADLTFVELPQVGAQVQAGQAVAVVESVKAASDIYAPVAGEVVAVNEALDQAPEAINQQPYADGWLFKLKPGNPADLEGLLDAAAYRELAPGD